MINSLPYKIRYADGVEECKKCSEIIRSGHLQMAIMIQSDDDDCCIPRWYHVKCFFKTCLPRTEAAFDGFAKLRYADQLTIKEHLGTLEVNHDIEIVQTQSGFCIEFTRRGQVSCAKCQNKIKKGEIRIMNVVHDENQNTAFDGKAVWYHTLCFARSRSELGWLQSGESMPGFKRLSELDKETVKRQIPLISRGLNQLTAESRTNPNKEGLEKLIEEQNKEYYELYDKLSSVITDHDGRSIFRVNGQMIPKSRVECLHHLTDIILYGALQACSECGIRSLVFADTTYLCSHVRTWSKCSNEVKEPQREITVIPGPLLKKYPFLKLNRPVRTRALHSFRLTDENGQDLVYAPYKHPPLFNMEFVIVGKFKLPTQEIERKLRKMGAKVVEDVHDRLTAVISNHQGVESMRFEIRQAKKFKIQVILDDFLTEDFTNTDPYQYIIENDIAGWGIDPHNRIEQSKVVPKKTNSSYTQSLPEKITYKWKDGCAVDPESGLEDDAHVYSEIINGKRMEFSVILGLVDIENDKNSYYRIQMLESNQQNMYWLFESWGRISTLIGSKRLKMVSKVAGIEKFTHLYREKTGNDFGNQGFIKKPGKYYHLEIEFDLSKQTPNTNIKSKLSDSVYQLMQMLFDLKRVENMITKTCDLDLKQMPLGKISANQIKAAMTVLGDISNKIEHSGSLAKLREASCQFYTLIPHGFGINRLTIIDSIETVNEKNELLESLLNTNLIYEFLDGNNDKCNPLDACYQKLHTKIEPVDQYSSTFLQIWSAVQNTHGATHNWYTYEVLEVFEVRREDEDERFQQYAHLPNHQLLWHGSRLSNIVSILSNGLKIAPPEAPANGYMYNKGIYFADVASKAANYCIKDNNVDVGLMLLCEVALGQTQDHYFAKNNLTGLPNAKQQSVRACGITVPTKNAMIDGVNVASGGLQRVSYQSALLYNEYVVYDPTQVRIKYLVKLKFHYK
ncbi:poly [ADP-ribose] polymerase-like [Sitodiplosis mosellana]|uniref:poly [ADP-ribose] polymerase-like n=1 Tax=Sitodiplosis mosellana TaxID=263140 RepID=UPI002444E121|nr:poly [ADP-ribose] polymerase-like [Sitodiplosis mosellana]